MIVCIVTCTVGGVDYDSGPIDVTFSAGEMTVSFNISTFRDNILELNETYNLVVAIDPLINSSVNITTDTTTVTIIDDDRKWQPKLLMILPFYCIFSY